METLKSLHRWPVLVLMVLLGLFAFSPVWAQRSNLELIEENANAPFEANTEDDDPGDDGNDDGGDDDGDDDGNDDGDDDGNDDGDDDGNDDGDDDGNDDGDDDGNDDGDDDGNDDGDDDGNDDGNDDGDDDGNDDGDDDGNDDSDDDTFEVGFDDDSLEVKEDAGVALVIVELSDEAPGLVMVDYTTVSDTAIAGEDFEATSGTLVWDTGDDQEQTIEIPIFEDALEEGNEQLIVVLSNPFGVELDQDDSRAEVTIIDNDGAFACQEDDDTLCLQEDRFEVEVAWEHPNGLSGVGQAESLSESTGLFWFFSGDNFELMLKVLDGCGVPGLEGYWVIFAATTDMGLTVRVTDTQTGLMKEYLNPPGQAAEPVQDFTTFDTCP
ncbi:MAG: hypothetical protein MI919_05020 [Holophagales bacterium]|nr:hypothetical protein [Holophagales bacterium]